MDTPKESKASETPGASIATTEETATAKTSKFSICDDKKCENKGSNNCFRNICELDIPNTSTMLDVERCMSVGCDYRRKAPPLTEIDEPIFITFNSRSVKDCCTGNEPVGSVANIHGPDPCDCTCVCSMGLVKKTTYCKTCGGYEVAGEDLKSSDGKPCPVCRKLTGKEQKVAEDGVVKDLSDHTEK